MSELDELKNHFNKALNGVSKDIKGHINRTTDKVHERDQLLSDTPAIQTEYDVNLAGLIYQLVQNDAGYAKMTIEQIQEHIGQRLTRNAVIRNAVLSVELFLAQSQMSVNEIYDWETKVCGKKPDWSVTK